jgi:adenylate cyclase
MLRLTLFGGFSAAGADGAKVPLKSQKSKALLAYLSLPPGKPRSREQIMALLWSERGDAQARASLRQVLTGLRKELGEEAMAALIITDDAISLNPDKVTVAAANAGEELLAGFHLHDPAFEEWLRDERLRIEDTAVPGNQPAEPSRPDKPSIAVLPFTNMSGDPEQEYFADGITEDIITELSRFRSLFVIARISSFHYKGASPKVQDVGRELGVQYVVEGSVRKAANRVRITAQLVEAESGNHLWAEHYDRELEDIFAVQDEVTRTVVSTVAGRIDAVGHQRANRMSPDSLKAYDLCLRAISLIFRFTKADNAKARELLAQAIALDPVNVHAHCELSTVYLMDWVGHWVVDGDAALSEALRWGKQAVALDDADSWSHCVLGEAYHFNREFDKARFHLEKAINLNPNDVGARGVYGQFLTCVGETDKALAEFEYARQIDPHDIVWLPWIRGFAYFHARQYDAAIACFEQIENRHCEVCALLAASYAHVGRLDEAKSMLEEFLRRAEEEMVDFPGHSIAAWRRSWHSLMIYKDKADVEMWLDGLHKAGLED